MINLQAIAARYSGKVSGNTVRIPTPGHSLKDRGTSITLDPSAPDGCLVHCFNGTENDALAVKDMLRKDGFLPEHSRRELPSYPLEIDWESLLATAWQTADEADAWAKRLRWDYTDAEGNLLYRKVRTDFPSDGKPKKGFRYERPDGSLGKGDQPHVLYRLRDLVQSDGLIFMAEGEKCADKLASWGLRATSSKDADKCDLSVLRGRQVVILPDNDAEGASIASKAAQAAREAGASPLVIELPGLPEKGDIIDWEGTRDDLFGLIKTATTKGSKPAKPWLVSAGEFLSQPSPPRWIIRDLFEEGTFGMIHGPSGSGKSFVTIDIAMHLACGRTAWHGSAINQNGPVVYLAGEGHYGMRRRLAAWVQHYGHEPSQTQLHISQTGCDLDQAEGYQKTLDAIHSLAEPPILIIVDTLHRFLSGDENSAKDSRAMITACDKIREEFGCALILVHHTGVSEEAQHRARGSSAWKGAVDFEYSIMGRSEALVMVSRKSKDGPDPKPRRFAFEEITLGDWIDEDGNPTKSVILLPLEAKEETKPDAKTKQFLGWYEEAWIASEQADLDGRPFLTRADMLAYLQTQHNMQKRSAENHLAPSREGYFVKTLTSNRKIEKADGGWILTEPELASVLLLLRDTPSAPLGDPQGLEEAETKAEETPSLTPTS